MSARRKYAWEDWFARPRTVLVRGMHYECSQSAMVQMVRNNASARGVSVKITDDDVCIILDVTGRTGGKEDDNEVPCTNQASEPAE